MVGVSAASLSQRSMPSHVLRPPPPPPPQPHRLVRSVCCLSSGLYTPPLVEQTLSRILSSGVIACLRANSAEMAMEAARAAVSAGISVLEIVAGTVLNVEDAKKATNAGAKFIMSPAMVKDIMDDYQTGEVLYMPGVMTPTEILCAHDAGAKIVKVYPVSALGGIKYISALKKPFSHISMVASQGITIDSIGGYIALGASSVVLSDAIFNKEALCQNNFNEIYQLAHFAALQGKEAVERKRKFMSNLSHQG